MKKQLFILFFIVVCIFSGYSQTFIGEHKLMIKKDIKENHQDFYFAKEVLSEKQNFIKFEDADGYQTWLFVLTEEGYCKYSILMCDYSLLKEVVDSLNSHYEYKKDMLWVDYFSGKDDYIITLKKEDWFFSVKTKVMGKEDLKKIK